MGGGGSSSSSFQFWDVLNAQSRAAKEIVETSVTEYKDASGATASVNYSGYQQLTGSNWYSNFERGNGPHLFSADTIFTGRFAEEGWLMPFEEWKGLLDDDVIENIQWLIEPFKQSNSWKGKLGMEQVIHTLPIMVAPQEPFQVRTDHLEKAGLNPKKDFPPKNFDDLLRVATALKENGPSDIGFQLHGDLFDWYTLLTPMVFANGGEGGYFADDFTRCPLDSDVWIDAMEKTVSLYREHKVSGPQTPNISTEQTLALMTSGQASMSICEPMDMPQFAEKGPEKFTNGDLRWGSFWEGSGGLGSTLLPFGMGVTKKPDGADEAKWKKQHEAAIGLLNRWLSKEFQKKVFKNTGFYPVREDVWDEVADTIDGAEKNQAPQTIRSMIERTEHFNTTHPLYNSFSGSTIGPKFQSALKGEMSPTEVCKKAAVEGNKQLDEYWSSRQ
ncbi:extracellular solute-binding protein [Halocatena marina]|uniref:Extracellular solute-binding protein n=1 Tax=Halocatena marina TaxID=2934937 RepID=A0ABD5YJZ2_9EURY